MEKIEILYRHNLTTFENKIKVETIKYAVTQQGPKKLRIVKFDEKNEPHPFRRDISIDNLNTITVSGYDESSNLASVREWSTFEHIDEELFNLMQETLTIYCERQIAYRQNQLLIMNKMLNNLKEAKHGSIN